MPSVCAAFHGDERSAFVLPDVVDGANVGMVQRGGGLRLALESGQGLWVSGYFFGKELQGDKAAQTRVFSLVDNAHATATQLLDDAVVRDGLADHQGQILRRRNWQVNESRGY
jgi:hypothetical protein